MKKIVRASDRKHHIVYKTTCKQTKRFYVGLHSTDDMDDGYLGSGKRLRRSVKKYGKEQHFREILFEFNTRQEASDKEKELITLDLLVNPNCMNCGVGGLGAVDRPTTSEETRKKMSTIRKGRKLSEETKQKISKANTGIKRTEEQILLMRQRLKGIKMPDRSKEHCKNISIALKCLSGKKIFTDGKINKKFTPGKEPYGWVLKKYKNKEV